MSCLLVVLQADILQCVHSCDVVILMHHRHGLGDTVTCYGTQGAGVSFIGNKTDVKRSDGGQLALLLFKKFLEGKFYNGEGFSLLLHFFFNFDIFKKNS